MRIPPKDDPHGDREGRLPLADVVLVLRRHGVSVEVEGPDDDGDFELTAILDDVAEVFYVSDPIGGVMIGTIVRMFDIDKIEFYYFRQIDAQNQKPTPH